MNNPWNHQTKRDLGLNDSNVYSVQCTRKIRLKNLAKKLRIKISAKLSRISTAVSNFCHDIRRIAMTRIDYKLFILNNYKFSMHAYFLSNCRSNKYEKIIYLELCSAALTIGHAEHRAAIFS